MIYVMINDVNVMVLIRISSSVMPKIGCITCRVRRLAMGDTLGDGLSKSVSIRISSSVTPGIRAVDGAQPRVHPRQLEDLVEMDL
ncbi:hypothetical protein ACLOJK_035063 [Asimina triloba]